MLIFCRDIGFTYSFYIKKKKIKIIAKTREPIVMLVICSRQKAKKNKIISLERSYKKKIIIFMLIQRLKLVYFNTQNINNFHNCALFAIS